MGWILWSEKRFSKGIAGAMNHTKEQVAEVQKDYLKIIKQIDTLLDGWTAGKVSEELYTSKMEQYEKKRALLVEKRNKLNKGLDSHIKKVEDVINFTKNIKERFETASPARKKEFVLNLGYQIQLKDKKLIFKRTKLMDCIVNIAKDANTLNYSVTKKSMGQPLTRKPILMKNSVTQVGRNWNQLVRELISWDKFAKEVFKAKSEAEVCSL